MSAASPKPSRGSSLNRYGIAAACLVTTAAATELASDLAWTDREKRVLSSLSLPTPVEAPSDPSNRYADDLAAAQLGKRLFFDTRLSGNGEISCASCHQPGRYFTDSLPRSIGIGTTLRNAPTIVGSAFNRWHYWDGRRDSLWAQALIPFEAADEMGSSRVAVTRFVADDAAYREMYEAVFGGLPSDYLALIPTMHAGPLGSRQMRDAWQKLAAKDKQEINRVYANLGKAIAAFERTLMPSPTRFDRYVIALETDAEWRPDNQLTATEIAGVRLFMNSDKTQCLQCHNGPMFTNGDFHNIGSGNFSGPHMDFGRVFGLRAVLMDEFNCVGPYSDADKEQCVDLRFLNKDSHVPLQGAFKVPSLRGLTSTAPYFHDGRFDALADVLAYYNQPPLMEEVGPHELRNLGLTDTELGQIESFLLTISE